MFADPPLTYNDQKKPWSVPVPAFNGCVTPNKNANADAASSPISLFSFMEVLSLLLVVVIELPWAGETLVARRSPSDNPVGCSSTCCERIDYLLMCGLSHTSPGLGME